MKETQVNGKLEKTIKDVKKFKKIIKEHIDRLNKHPKNTVYLPLLKINGDKGEKGDQTLEIQSDLQRLKFWKVILNNIKFKQCDFNNSTFHKVYFNTIEFENCDLQDDIFYDVTISDSDLSNSLFNNSLFCNVDMLNTLAQKISMDGCDFTGNFRAENVNFDSSSFKNCTMKDTTFINCNFKDTDLSETIFTNARFIDCGFSGTKFFQTIRFPLQILSVGPLGSGRRYTNYDLENDIVWSGCFTGTLKEFEDQINEKYPEGTTDVKFRNEYLGFIKYAESERERYKKSDIQK